MKTIAGRPVYSLDDGATVTINYHCPKCGDKHQKVTFTEERVLKGEIEFTCTKCGFLNSLRAIPVNELETDEGHRRER